MQVKKNKANFLNSSQKENWREIRIQLCIYPTFLCKTKYRAWS